MKPVPIVYQIPATRASGKLSLVEAIMAKRDISDKELNPEINGDWCLLIHDMDKAVKVIIEGIAQGKKIAIYGDYDVDGATAAALLYRGLLTSDGKILRPFVPERTDGYGLTKEGVDRLFAQGAQIIITVDNGSNAEEAVAYAVSLGIRVIVTDHHPVQDELMARSAVALVNPQLPSEINFPFLSGSGVAFMLLRALEKRGVVHGTQDLISYAACGTVADVMPIENVNRVLVRLGVLRRWWKKAGGLAFLDLLAQGVEPAVIDAFFASPVGQKGVDDLYKRLFRSDNYGFPKWARNDPLFVDENPELRLFYINGRISSRDLGFEIGPRINAAGRMGNAHLALDFLLCDDPKEAWVLAKKLDELNDQRKQLQKLCMKEAEEMLEGMPDTLHSICLASRKWDSGIVGPVAAQLSRKYARPTFIGAIEDDAEFDAVVHGSGRSIDGISCKELLEGTAKIKGGGHAAAAGFLVKADEFQKFAKGVEKNCRQVRPERLLETVIPVDVLWGVPSSREINEVSLVMEPLVKSSAVPTIALEEVVVSEIFTSKKVESTYTRYLVYDPRNPDSKAQIASFTPVEGITKGSILKGCVVELDGAKLKMCDPGKALEPPTPKRVGVTL